MSWNYRVLHRMHPEDEQEVFISEVHYDDAGQPRGWQERTTPSADDLEALHWVLDEMKAAMALPVLYVQADETLAES